MDAETEGDGLSNHYDAIIVGTGIIESIVACAIQLIPGKRVLHLDSVDFYGREQATMNLRDIVDLAREGCLKSNLTVEGEEALSPPIEEIIRTCMQNGNDGDILRTEDIVLLQGKDPEAILKVLSHSDGIDEIPRIAESHRQAHPACKGYRMEASSPAYCSSSKTHPAFFGYLMHRKITLARALHDSRRFSLDLSTKLLMGGESMVECMVSSDVGRYLEFKGIENIYLLARDDNKNPIWEVSCSKSDVFNSKLLTAIEKRILMKFLQFASDWGQYHAGEELSTLNERELSKGAALLRPQNKGFNSSEFSTEGFEEKPFKEFLDAHRIPIKLQHVILYAVCLEAMSSRVSDGFAPQTTVQALYALSLNISSLGKYGNTAFLYPIYGTGEIIQSFCRMCAVWGGTYILRRGIKSVVVDRSNNTARGVIDTTGRVFSCSNVVISAYDWNKEYFSDIRVLTRISICVGDTSIFSNSSRTFVVIPPCTTNIDNPFVVHILQLNSSVNICPEGSNILHITTQYPSSVYPNNLLDKIMSYLHELTFFEEVFHISFSKSLLDKRKLDAESLPNNVYVCGEDYHTVHFEEAVRHARRIFSKMYPSEVFLLSPPKVVHEENLENEEDAILRSALDMIEVDKKSRTHTFDNTDDDKTSSF